MVAAELGLSTMVFSYLVGAMQLEHLGPLSGTGTLALAELPADEYPHTTANARRAQHVSVDEEFTEGLRALLRGLAITPSARESPSSSRD